MTQPHRFLLIDGDFTATEAKKVLLDLVASKIQFHSLQQFSHQERYSTTPPLSTRRIAALKKLELDLITLLDQAEANGSEISIHSTIELTLKTPTSKAL